MYIKEHNKEVVETLKEIFLRDMDVMLGYYNSLEIDVIEEFKNGEEIMQCIHDAIQSVKLIYLPEQ